MHFSNSFAYFSTAVMQTSIASSFISTPMSENLTMGYFATRKNASMSSNCVATVALIFSPEEYSKAYGMCNKNRLNEKMTEQKYDCALGNIRERIRSTDVKSEASDEVYYTR